MQTEVRTIDIGLFPAHEGLPQEAAALLEGVSSGASAIAVSSEDEVGFIRWFSVPAADVPHLTTATGSWTRYEVRAGAQRGSLDGLRALVLSEEDAFQHGAAEDVYERWVDEVWGPGVTELPGYRAAFLMRGVSGPRSGKYASIGFFPSSADREDLLVALTDHHPPELAEYRKLIDEAFARFLDRDRRRFMRLDVLDGQ